MHALEDRYWWFVGRRLLALRLLKSALPTESLGGPGRTPVLDLGCGTGVVLGELRGICNPVGLDMSTLALRFCRTRGLSKLVRGKGEAIPIGSGRLEAIVALDIFEHIEADASAFAEAARALAPGGALVMSVPAFMSLWGPHDVALHHFRRYRRRQLRDKLGAAGFERVRISHAVFFLFPIVVGFRILEKLKGGKARASLPSVPSWLNSLLIALQAFEAAIVERLPLPWGSSLVAVAFKPKR